MAIEIIIPRLGWSMEEGKFVAWLKQEGELIQAGEALFSIEGDKAIQEIESIDSGILHFAPNAPRPGETIRVGDLLGYLLSPGEDMPSGASVHQASESVIFAEPAPRGNSSVSNTAPAQERTTPAISPRALRVAAELGVDWLAVRGSGRTGRIREKDIRLAASRATAPASGSTRETIARRMLQSVRNTAPVTLHTTCRADGLVKLRQHWKATADNGGATVPSYTDMLVKLAATALGVHPALNAYWEDDTLVLSPSIHIGVAVDTDAGLLAPIIRDVPRMSLKAIASHSQELIKRARARKLSPEEMQRGTFTVTSLGAFGIDAFTPIINYPQCAILGVGRIRRQPVTEGTAPLWGEVITLSLTFDHCALDGVPAARFLQTLCRLIEEETGDVQTESVLTRS